MGQGGICLPGSRQGGGLPQALGSFCRVSSVGDHGELGVRRWGEPGHLWSERVRQPQNPDPATFSPQGSGRLLGLSAAKVLSTSWSPGEMKQSVWHMAGA